MAAFKNTIAGILFICVLADPVAGTFIWLHYQKTIIKKEVRTQIRAGIDRDDLVLVKLSKKEVQTKLKWEHSGEFEYGDQMYDVVDTLTLGDMVYYWCWRDHKETKLNRRLDKLAARTLGKDDKIKEKSWCLISFFRSLYCTAPTNWMGLTSKSVFNLYCFLFDIHSSITIQPPTPPPQLI